MSPPADTGVAAYFGQAAGEHDAAVAERGAVVAHLDIAARRLRLTFAGGELAAALLGPFAARVGPAAGDVDVHLALWERGAGPLRAPWAAQDVLAAGAVRDDDGAVTVVQDPGSGAVTAFAPDGRRLLYSVPDAAGLPWWERAAPLRTALFWALGGPGRGLVHGGAVGDERGGVLLAGRGGSGKTTLALAAVDAGLAYVADDYVLLEGGPEPVAWNVFGTAKLDDGHLARFPGLSAGATRSVPAAPDEKAVLDLAAARPGQLRDHLPIRAVAIPRITGGATVARRVSGARGLLALAPSTIFQMPFDDGAVLRVLAGVVHAVPCFELDVGDDPAALAPALDRVLTEAAG